MTNKQIEQDRPNQVHMLSRRRVTDNFKDSMKLYSSKQIMNNIKYIDLSKHYLTGGKETMCLAILTGDRP